MPDAIPLEQLNREYPVLELGNFNDMRVQAQHAFPFTPRPKQLDLVAQILNEFETKNVVAFQGETGVGKSVIGYTLASVLGNAYYLTNEKFLQDQILRDFGPGSDVSLRFPNFVVEELKGRGAYECRFDDLDPKPEKYKDRWDRPLTCGDGICIRQKADGSKRNFRECMEQRRCPYYQQKRRARDAQMAVMNYHSFFYNVYLNRGDDSEYAPLFGQRKLMILDEGHNVESAVLGFMQITLSDRDLHEIGIVVPEFETVEAYIDWIRRSNAHEELRKIVSAIEAEKVNFQRVTTRREMRVIEQYAAMNALLKLEDTPNWVVEYACKDLRDPDTHRVVFNYHTATFKPVKVGRYVQQFFFPYAEKILIMSATLLSEDYQRLTLELDAAAPEYRQFTYIDAPNDFPAAQRPVYVYPSGSMNKGRPGDVSPQAETLPRLVEDITAIARRYDGQRGVIHTHTHAIARWILEHSPEDVQARFLYQEDYENDRGAMVEDFRTKPGAIIVAPRMYEGLDCPDDVARWQVICKMPYPDMGNPQQRKRIEQMALYFPHYTTTRVIQAWGRIIRHAKDWGHTFILDEAYYRWVSSARKFRLLPSSFRDAVAGRETNRRISSIWYPENDYGRKKK